jgi:hypothetical protein
LKVYHIKPGSFKAGTSQIPGYDAPRGSQVIKWIASMVKVGNGGIHPQLRESKKQQVDLPWANLGTMYIVPCSWDGIEPTKTARTKN